MPQGARRRCCGAAAPKNPARRPIGRGCKSSALSLHDADPDLLAGLGAARERHRRHRAGDPRPGCRGWSRRPRSGTRPKPAFACSNRSGSCSRACAARRTLLIVLDDLHWADAPSLRLLEFLAPELGDSRILLVGTYRATELSRRHPLSNALGGSGADAAFRAAQSRRAQRRGGAGLHRRRRDDGAGRVGEDPARPDRGQSAVPARDRAVSRAARRPRAAGWRCRAAGDPHPRGGDRGDRPPSQPPLRRLQRGPGAGFGDRPRLRLGGVAARRRAAERGHALGGAGRGGGGAHRRGDRGGALPVHPQPDPHDPLRRVADCPTAAISSRRRQCDRGGLSRRPRPVPARTGAPFPGRRRRCRGGKGDRLRGARRPPRRRVARLRGCGAVLSDRPRRDRAAGRARRGGALPAAVSAG